MTSNREVLGPPSDHLCYRCGARAQTWHHRLAAGRGGPTDPYNVVPLCGDGTTGCHGWAEHHPADAQRIGLDVPGSFLRGRYVGPDVGYREHYNGEFPCVCCDGWVKRMGGTADDPVWVHADGQVPPPGAGVHVAEPAR